MNESRIRFFVLDQDKGEEVQLDVSNCKSWGPVPVDRGWFGDFPEYMGDQMLYRHPTGHWTLVEELTHFESGLRDIPTASRLDDEQAAKWLANGSFELPECLPAEIRKRLIFEPGEPVPTIEAPPEKPIWNDTVGELYFAGGCIRKVKKQAKNLRAVLGCFHDDGWPSSIDSPFPEDEPGKIQLRETVRQLNDGLTRIRFRSDGKGKGVLWGLVSVDPWPPF